MFGGREFELLETGGGGCVTVFVVDFVGPCF